MVCCPSFICQAEALKHGYGLGFPEGFPWLRGLTRPVNWEWVAKGCRAQNPPSLQLQMLTSSTYSKGAGLTSVTFSKKQVLFFLKDGASLIIFLQETSRTWQRICLLHGGLLVLKVIQVIDPDLFSAQSVCHNYQVMGLWDGEEHCRKKNKT